MMDRHPAPTMPLTLNCRGRLLSLERPLVMGILNVTPDSFSDGGKYMHVEQAVSRAGEMLREGADILDIGAASSRPGAEMLPAELEWERMAKVLKEIVARYPQALISVDTFHEQVAGNALEAGAHIINDISAGRFSPGMFRLAARERAPICLMHMQGEPQTMQVAPQYEDVVESVYMFLVERVRAARADGVVDLIIDPGFGFGKTMAHNYDLLRNLGQFQALSLPILVGISRKSMVYKLFSTTPEDVLELTTALHIKALEAGARILRVHDVRAAVRAVQLHHFWQHGTL